MGNGIVTEVARTRETKEEREAFQDSWQRIYGKTATCIKEIGFKKVWKLSRPFADELEIVTTVVGSEGTTIYGSDKNGELTCFMSLAEIRVKDHNSMIREIGYKVAE